MSSASRSLVGVLVCGALAGSAVFAQEMFFRGGRRADPEPVDARTEYDGRFSFVRLRYQGGFRRNPGWAHDYPRADWHFQRILEEITYTRTLRDESNIMTLDDPELGLYPVVYMSEPGFWTLTEAETLGLRTHLQKGGFIIFDDFRGAGDWGNLEARMREVLPEARWHALDATHPVFHAFFDINRLVEQGYYGPAQFLGLFEDNDPGKRLLAIANYNHDLGELWEFSDTGWMPVELSNEAYKYGVNYVIYAMTH